MLEDTPANRRRMEAVLKKIDAEITLGTFDYGKYFPNSRKRAEFAPHTGAGQRSELPRFADFARQWRHEKAVEWRRAYAESIDSILRRHLLPEFGERLLGTIERAQVLDFRSRLANAGTTRARSAVTVNRVIGVMRMILEEAAVRHGTPNPCLGIKRLKIQRTDIQPFTIEEVRQILDAVRPDYRNYLTVRFFTGLRSGEVNGLKWKHVDFERRQILIRETYSRGYTEYTKTDGSQREIDMCGLVYDALRAQKPPVAKDEDYVFHTRNGGPIDNKNFDARVWRPLLRHLGLKPRRPYQMRHTCATLWLAAGENPQWIARQLGHTTTEMLFRTYARFVPNLTRRDGSAFDRMLTAALNGGLSETLAGHPAKTSAGRADTEARHG